MRAAKVFPPPRGCLTVCVPRRDAGTQSRGQLVAPPTIEQLGLLTSAPGIGVPPLMVTRSTPARAARSQRSLVRLTTSAGSAVSAGSDSSSSVRRSVRPRHTPTRLVCLELSPGQLDAPRRDSDQIRASYREHGAAGCAPSSRLRAAGCAPGLVKGSLGAPHVRKGQLGAPQGWLRQLCAPAVLVKVSLGAPHGWFKGSWVRPSRCKGSSVRPGWLGAAARPEVGERAAWCAPRLVEGQRGAPQGGQGQLGAPQVGKGQLGAPQAG